MSKIEWCDETWNPVVGCSVVSPGCTNCYAMRQAARVERMLDGMNTRAGGGVQFSSSHYAGTTKETKAGPVWTGKVALASDETLTAPLRWKRPRAIFVNSMGDLFHEAVPDAWIDRVFAVMALAPQHTFIVLTKRAKRMREWIISRAALDERGQPAEDVRVVMTALAATPSRREMAPALKAIPMGKYCAAGPWPLPNVILGVSAEDQERADERIPDLLATPAAKRVVSAEPLLGAVDFQKWFGSSGGVVYDGGGGQMDYVEPTGPDLDGVIVGGESGPGARPMHPDWARAIRDQCEAAGVAFHFKQWGGWAPTARPTVKGDATVWPNGAVGKGDANISGAGREMNRVGKRAAGRLLDGREHNDLPWTVAASNAQSQ